MEGITLVDSAGERLPVKDVVLRPDAGEAGLTLLVRRDRPQGTMDPRVAEPRSVPVRPVAAATCRPALFSVPRTQDQTFQFRIIKRYFSADSGLETPRQDRTSAFATSSSVTLTIPPVVTVHYFAPEAPPSTPCRTRLIARTSMPVWTPSRCRMISRVIAIWDPLADQPPREGSGPVRQEGVSPHTRSTSRIQ